MTIKTLEPKYKIGDLVRVDLEPGIYDDAPPYMVVGHATRWYSRLQSMEIEYCLENDFIGTWDNLEESRLTPAGEIANDEKFYIKNVSMYWEFQQKELEREGETIN